MLYCKYRWKPKIISTLVEKKICSSKKSNIYFRRVMNYFKIKVGKKTDLFIFNFLFYLERP